MRGWDWCSARGWSGGLAWRCGEQAGGAELGRWLRCGLERVAREQAGRRAWVGLTRWPKGLAGQVSLGSKWVGLCLVFWLGCNQATAEARLGLGFS